MFVVLRILLITGRLAEGYVRRVVGRVRTRHVVDVLALPVQVIALLSTSDIVKSLKRLGVDLGGYDLVIIPGHCRGSARVIEEVFGVPAVKGTIHADDLELVLQLENPLETLSPDKPADEVLGEYIARRNAEVLGKLNEESRHRSILVGKTYIPVNPPPQRIIAEITNTHLLGGDELLRIAHRYLGEGADIISLGFEPFNPRPDRVSETVKLLRRELGEVTIAIDTLIPSEIISGLRSGADLVLSIDLCNMDKIPGEYRDSAYVIIPYDSCKDYLPRTSNERISLIEKIVERLGERGFEKLIIDPILDPPITGSILDSLTTYRVLRGKYSDKPLMMGVGNVVELFDADSIGLNALLAYLAYEAGASLLLTVEASTKTLGSVRELVIASQMISLAHTRRSPPKDLGIDLLVLKDKRRINIPIETEGAEIVVLEDYRVPVRIDRMGIFKIRVDHGEGLIDTLYIGVKGKILIRSRSAEAIINYILDKGLVSSMQHAFYLGRELAKAEEALRIGKNYVQEKPLFIVKKPLMVPRSNG